MSKYARLVVRVYYLLREANSFPRENILFIILQIFFATRRIFSNLMGNITRILPSYSRGIFSHVTRFDQSRTSENIWWMISKYRAFLGEGLIPGMLTSPAIYFFKRSVKKTQKNSVREKLKIFGLFYSPVTYVFFECGRARLICVLFQGLFNLKEPHQLQMFT